VPGARVGGWGEAVSARPVGRVSGADLKVRQTLRTGGSADLWWLGWTLLTLAVAFGIAAVASGRA